MTKTLGIALALGMLILTGAGVGFAQVINGCVKSNGQLTIVSGAGQCKSTEAPISWNVTGPQGPAGVTAGINAAVWGEYILNPADPTQHCSVPFFRGADGVVGASTGNDGECRLNFTLPANQPQSWGTAYTCSTAIVNGNGTPFDTACHYEGGMDPTTLKPAPIFQCLNGGGTAAPAFAQITFLCITE